MPQAQRDGPADDGRLTAYRPGKERWLQLPAVLAGMFPSPQTSIEFLERDMRIPGSRIPGFGLNEAPEEYWLKVLHLFDTGDLIDSPYQRLFLAVQNRKLFNAPFDSIFGDYPRTDPEAGRVVAPRIKGCHVIVRTTNELVRDRIWKWLKDEALEPQLVWSVHQMTSFEVTETDDQEVRALITGRWARLLVKVIPPGQPDELIEGRLWVFDTDDQALPVPDVPIQLTVAELGAVAALFHPAATSTHTRTTGGRRRAKLATHVGDGVTQQVPLDGTLWQWGVSEDHRISIKSLKYGRISIVFVGACPRQIEYGRLGEVRITQELSEIRRSARRRHITVVRDFQNATFEHLADIMETEPDILHIACHGKDGRLYWEDNEGDQRDIAADELARCIAERTGGRRLSGIVVSACDGASAGPSLTAAARVVIAHKGQVLDNVAIDFTTRFYDELARMPVLATAARRADTHDSVQIFPPDGQGGGS